MNTFGALLLTQALLPNIELNDYILVAFMCLRIGFIGDNFTGCMYFLKGKQETVLLPQFQNCGEHADNLGVDLKSRIITLLVVHSGTVHGSDVEAGRHRGCSRRG